MPARLTRRDLELERMARQVMRLPFNAPGSDKSHVLRAMWHWNAFFAAVRRSKKKHVH